MLPVLQAEEAKLMVNTLLATNTRVLDEDGRGKFLRGLDDDIQGRGRAPKASSAFLRRAGFRMGGEGGETHS